MLANVIVFCIFAIVNLVENYKRCIKIMNGFIGIGMMPKLAARVFHARAVKAAVKITNGEILSEDEIVVLETCLTKAQNTCSMQGSKNLKKQ